MISRMTPLPNTLYYAADVRELDRIAIQERGIPGIELMNRAGAAVFETILNRWPRAREVVVFCGGGNNGGDGFVIARLANERGLRPRLIALEEVDGLNGDARRAWGAARSAGLSLTPYDPALLKKADVIVDAIFGSGLNRSVSGRYAAVVEAINASGAPVIAVDVPSGLQVDQGTVLGCAVKADATVTFIGLKVGLLTGQGPEHCGELLFSDLGVPKDIYNSVDPRAERIDWPSLRPLLARRNRSAHKGHYGHVLMMGGNHGMAGAARMAAEAAARVGAGLTSVAMRQAYAAAMAAARPEIMWRGLTDDDTLDDLLSRVTVVAIGPGLGRDDWARQLFDTAVNSSLPLVVDADALNLLAEQPRNRGYWILTPHVGEAARLLQCRPDDINRDRVGAARRLQQRFDGVVVLKGAGSIICGEAGDVAICSGGNPGMASGGMGDALTGIIAGLMAQGLPFESAAKAGVALHAAAGDEAARGGERGMLAMDLIACLRLLVN